MRISTKAFTAVIAMGEDTSKSAQVPKHPFASRLKKNYINWQVLRELEKPVPEKVLIEMVGILLSDQGPRDTVSREVMAMAYGRLSQFMDIEDYKEVMEESLAKYESIKDAATIDNWFDQNVITNLMKVVSELLPAASPSELRALIFLAHREHLVEDGEVNPALALSTKWIFLEGGLDWNFYLGVDKKFCEARQDGNLALGEFTVELSELRARQGWGAHGNPVVPMAVGAMPGTADAVTAPPSENNPVAAAMPGSTTGNQAVVEGLQAIANGGILEGDGVNRKRAAVEVTPAVGEGAKAKTLRRRDMMDKSGDKPGEESE